MPSTDRTKAAITRYLLEYSKNNLGFSGPVDLSTPLTEQDFDSLDVIELAMNLEDEFLIEMPAEVSEKWTSLQDAFDSVLSYIALEQ